MIKASLFSNVIMPCFFILDSWNKSHRFVSSSAKFIVYGEKLLYLLYCFFLSPLLTFLGQFLFSLYIKRSMYIKRFYILSESECLSLSGWAGAWPPTSRSWSRMCPACRGWWSMWTLRYIIIYLCLEICCGTGSGSPRSRRRLRRLLNIGLAPDRGDSGSRLKNLYFWALKKFIVDLVLFGSY